MKDNASFNGADEDDLDGICNGLRDDLLSEDNMSANEESANLPTSTVDREF